MPFRKASPKIGKDEKLRMMMIFSIQLAITKQDISHAIFVVVEKDGKAIARNIAVHVDDESICEGHADEVAEYDIADSRELCDEFKELAMLYATKLAVDNGALTIDTQKPIFFMLNLKGAETAEVGEELRRTPEVQGVSYKGVLLEILGFNEQKPAEQPMTLPKIENEAKKQITAEQEQEMIDKYGKEAMEKLAKQMGFHGEILNKTNDENHVANN